MNLLTHPLFLLTFSPLLGVLVILLMREDHKTGIRWVAFISSLVSLALSIWVLILFNINNPGFQLTINQPWFVIGGLQISFYLSSDGLSLLMVLLTTFLTSLSILSTWEAINERVKGFMIVFLLMEASLLGVFLAMDLVLFYLFWEFTLIPMYFLIGIWGGERRIYAALKFFLFTMAGSVLLLLAILVMGGLSGSFSLDVLMNNRALFNDMSLWLFLAMGIAFAIKVPMFPFHTWLPDAHVEAPTAGSVILAGVLLKMGTYGFLRFLLPLFPGTSVSLAPWIGGLAVIGILYGAMVAYAQKDVKKLVAYSSISHLGFVMLGIFALNPIGISGAILQMVNHGLSTGALFLIVGMLYERRHTREMAAFGGLWKVMPFLGSASIIVALSSMGLPGLNGFVGEFTILLGSYGSTALASPWFTVLATLGVILAAVYLLTMLQRVFLGPVNNPLNEKLTDLSWREKAILLPLIGLIFWIGLYPQPFLNLITPTAIRIASLVQTIPPGLY